VKKIKTTKLVFEFDTNEELPNLNFSVSLKPKKETNKINIVKKKNGRDSSTLF